MSKPTVALLIGSARPDSNSFKLATLAKTILEDEGCEVTVVDPRDWKLGVPGLAPEEDQSEALQEKVRDLDGVLVVTPEYHGSYSSTLKLLIDNLGFPSVLKGKPVATLGVAAGRIGATKALEHLRSVLGHLGLVVLPPAISVANAFGAFAEDGSLKDSELEKLVGSVPRGLVAHLKERAKS